mgnify:CR=1 FL=1
MTQCKACEKEISIDEEDMGYDEVCNSCYNYIAYNEYPVETGCRRCGLNIEYVCPCGEKL